MAGRAEDITGRKFHKLTAVKRAGFREGAKCRKSLWLCRCDCGRDAIVAYVELLAGATKSCGCIIGQHKRTHGATDTPEFKVWSSMHRRCTDPKVPGYPRYGGRGISVCERWNDFANFLADVGVRPSPDHSIDRRDNDGNYEPANCRWATRIEQSNNRRSSLAVTLHGLTKTAAEWERERGLKPGIVSRRLAKGWDIEKALSPSRVYRRGRESVTPVGMSAAMTNQQ